MLDDSDCNYHEIVHIMIRVSSSYGRRFVPGAKHGVINWLGHVTRELAQLLGWSITTFFLQGQSYRQNRTTQVHHHSSHSLLK